MLLSFNTQLANPKHFKQQYRAKETPALKWNTVPTGVQTLLLQRYAIQWGNNPAALQHGSSTSLPSASSMG